MKIAITSILLFFLLVPPLFAQSTNSVPSSADSRIDADIVGCKSSYRDDHIKRGACAYSVYEKYGRLKVVDSGGDCRTNQDKSEKSVAKIEACQLAISQAKWPEPPAVPMLATNAPNIDTLLPTDSDKSQRPSSAPAHETEKSNRSDFVVYGSIFLGILAVGGLAVRGLMQVASERRRADSAEKTLKEAHDDLNGKHIQLSQDVGKLRAETKSAFAIINGDLEKVQQVRSRQPVAQPYQTTQPVPAVIQPAHIRVSDEHVGQALAEAVRKFVARDFQMVPTRGLDQILQCLSDERVASALRARGFEHKFLDIDGVSASSGQLLAIGSAAEAYWYVFPMPFSENDPRFSMWFDGYRSQSKIVATIPAIATQPFGTQIVLKTRGVLA